MGEELTAFLEKVSELYKRAENKYEFVHVVVDSLRCCFVCNLYYGGDSLRNANVLTVYSDDKMKEHNDSAIGVFNADIDRAD